jgi:hypothetical protein
MHDAFRRGGLQWLREVQPGGLTPTIGANLLSEALKILTGL